MKILVCISRTPDTTAKIAFVDNNTKFATEGVQWIINPYDEWYALVKAIEIKEKDPTASIHLLHVGGSDAESIIRKALALGGDEGIRIDSNATDPYFVACQIAAVANKEKPDIILTGKETIDHNNGSLGGMIAGIMDINFIGMATKLLLENDMAVVTREIEGGEEVLESPFPLVISCQKGMAEARIPNMRGIMSARTKPLYVVPPIEAASLTTPVEFSLPPAKAGVKYIPADHPELLVKLLREEAKVI